jgi:hypothetical protein
VRSTSVHDCTTTGWASVSYQQLVCNTGHENCAAHLLRLDGQHHSLRNVFRLQACADMASAVQSRRNAHSKVLCMRSAAGHALLHAVRRMSPEPCALGCPCPLSSWCEPCLHARPDSNHSIALPQISSFSCTLQPRGPACAPGLMVTTLMPCSRGVTIRACPTC